MISQESVSENQKMELKKILYWIKKKDELI